MTSTQAMTGKQKWYWSAWCDNGIVCELGVHASSLYSLRTLEPDLYDVAVQLRDDGCDADAVGALVGAELRQRINLRRAAHNLPPLQRGGFPSPAREEGTTR